MNPLFFVGRMQRKRCDSFIRSKRGRTAEETTKWTHDSDIFAHTESLERDEMKKRTMGGSCEARDYLRYATSRKEPGPTMPSRLPVTSFCQQRTESAGLGLGTWWQGIGVRYFCKNLIRRGSGKGAGLCHKRALGVSPRLQLVATSFCCKHRIFRSRAV